MRIRRLKHKLAISTIVANMLMIVITLSLAAILVAWAGTTYGAFSGGSQLYFNQRQQALQERFVIEEVYFNTTDPANDIIIFVRNVGPINITVSAIYINGNPQSTFAAAPTVPTGYCTALPVPLGVQQMCIFNVTYGSADWVSGTVFTIVVASSRGNQVTATARGP
jgi:hypothetical protein